MSNSSDNRFTVALTLNFLLVILLIGISGYNHVVSASKKNPNQRAARYVESQPAINEATRVQAMGYSLLAELAWDRHHVAEAIAYYLHTLSIYPDKRAAERATELSLMADAFTPALEASTIWARLAPENAHAQTVAITLQFKAELDQTAYNQLAKILANDVKQFTQVLLLVEAQLHQATEKELLLKTLYKMHQKKPGNVHVLYSLAEIAHKLHDYVKANQAIKSVLQKEPYWPQAIGLYVRMQRDKGESQEALSYLNQVLKKKPNLHSVRLLYAQLLIEQKDYAKAKTQLKKIIKQPGLKEDVHTQLAVIALDENDFSEAEKQLTAVLQLNPNHDAAHYYLAEIAHQNNELARSISLFSNVQFGPYYMSAQTKLAQLMAKSGDLPGALTRIHTLMLTYPQYNKHFTVTSVQILVAHKKATNAMQILNEAIKKSPNDIDYLYARSLVAAHLDDYSMTERDLRQVLTLDPNHTDALNALGFTLADKTDRYEEAMGYIQKAMLISPNNPAVIDSMGWILFRLGKYQESIKYLTKALELSGDSEIAAHLGEVLWTVGRKGEAIKTWEAALEQSPNHEVLLEVYQRFVEND